MAIPSPSLSFAIVVAVLLLPSPSLAGDPELLQDICVADITSTMKVNGFPCKATVTEDDFYFKGLANPGNTNNTYGSVVTGANVEKGTLDVGFITTGNKLIAKTITAGDVFVFPRGLVHFQKNNEDVPAAVISAFNSQLPGTQSLPMTLFAATPEVPNNVLTKAFQVGSKEVEKIKSRLAQKKS
uniref:Germin-like protein n=1 Tax=Setaria viridis TaxID=4556 RepID=A0A4U6VG18_SETVI|nr:hypothetical protein SEVIR_3G317200v2 [Setaria viridis]